MPTGYTAAIADGISFEEFAWKCARGMGALVMMRDDASDAPIPERFEPDDYHARRLAEARADLERVQSMGEAALVRDAAKAFDDESTRRAVRATKRAEQEAKYRAMLVKVQAWSPPTSDHAGFKSFMVEQITQSIDFDCRPYPDSSLVLLSPREHKAALLEKANRDIDYHAKGHADEVKRTEDRNQWIADLRRSLA